MNPDQYYRTLSRQPKVTQGTRFAVYTPYPHRYVPTPGTPIERIAFFKGRDAKDNGETRNPYPPQSPLAAHWARGYNAPN